MFDNKNSDGGVLIEANLECPNIEYVLDSFLDKGLDSKAGMIIRLKQNRTCISPLPRLTSSMKKLLFKKGIKPSETGKDAMTKIFREKRKLVVIRLSFESVIVVQNEVLALLKQKIVRQLRLGKLIKKCVDSVSFMSLIQNRHQNKRGETRTDIARRQVFPHIKSNRSSTAFKNRRSSKCCKQIKSRTVSLVKPRKYHTTTVVNDAQKDLLGLQKISAPVKCGDLTYIVSPNDSQEYNKPLFPEDGVVREDGCHEEDKFPTQVTEVDAGQLSVESTYKSLTAQSDGNPHSWQNNDNGDSHHRLSLSDRNIVASGTGLPRYTNPPRYPDYALERQRLASFQTSKWDIANKPDPFVLADCGFFFTGNLDLVRCHQCGIGLKDWIKEDDVLTEHVKYSASCDYLILKFGRVRVERMKIAVLNNDSERDATSSNAVQLPYKIRSPRYQTMEARMTSFKNFPQHIKLQHQQFAVAGLFYTGKGDLCRCFTCDGGLKDWSTGDDPIKEHAKYFPNCTYINQLKGQEYVLSLQRRDQNNELAGATGSNNAISQSMETTGIYVQNDYNAYSSVTISQVVQKLGYAEIDVITAKVELEKKGNRTPTAEDVVNTLLDMQERNESALNASQRDVNDLQVMVEENLRISNTIYCMLCANEADMLFLPCRHHRMCHECASVLEDCPVCDEYIQEKVKTFRS